MSHLNYTLQQLHDLTESLGTQAVAPGLHDLALSALLSAYATVAMSHPCCTQECANQTMRLAMMLATHAAQQHAADQEAGVAVPPSTQVH